MLRNREFRKKKSSFLLSHGTWLTQMKCRKHSLWRGIRILTPGSTSRSPDGSIRARSECEGLVSVTDLYMKCGTWQKGQSSLKLILVVITGGITCFQKLLYRSPGASHPHPCPTPPPLPHAPTSHLLSTAGSISGLLLYSFEQRPLGSLEGKCYKYTKV